MLIIFLLQGEVGRLKSSLEEKTSKISTLETEKRTHSGRLGQFESAVAKKNIELINKEVEINELKRTIENLEDEKSSLQDQIKNDTESKRMKEIYEGEKWKNLAEISSLKQQNEALKQRAQEVQEISSAFRAEVGELEKCKQDLVELRKEMDGSKKDKQIMKLTRKLEKANTEIIRLSKTRNSLDTSVFSLTEDVQPVRSASFLNLVTSKTVLSSQRRFSFFSCKHKTSARTKRTKFSRLGSLLYGDTSCALNRKPVISYSLPSSDLEKEEDNIMFNLNTSLYSRPKRKIDVSQSPPKKKLKGSNQTQISSMSAKPSPLTREIAGIRIISPTSIDHKFNSSLDEAPVHGSDSSEEDITGPEPLSTSTPCRMPAVTKVSQPKEFTTGFHTSKPLTIAENGSNQIFFNPNPSKSRQAHSSKKPEPVPPSRISVPTSRNTRISKPQVVNCSVLLPATKTDTVTSSSTARSKILQTGLVIEVNNSLRGSGCFNF